MQNLCWNFAWDGSSASLFFEEHVSYTKLPQIFPHYTLKFFCLSVHYSWQNKFTRHRQVRLMKLHFERYVFLSTANDGKSFSRKVASLNIIAHDVNKLVAIFPKLVSQCRIILWKQYGSILEGALFQMHSWKKNLIGKLNFNVPGEVISMFTFQKHGMRLACFLGCRNAVRQNLTVFTPM